ncbi:MAG: putative DNA binding domain-containing protein [bacterium]|nr:putative DNA binding domain-containing protein [bacterium]
MPLPVNIAELLRGQVVEWERLEFKEGWDSQPTIHSICAFANDINNWGGGYIIIGVKEENGRSVLPPSGLPVESIDRIQRELLNLCHKLQPTYFPIVVPEVVSGRHILVLWCPGGENRPYKAPESLSNNNHNHAYYVRRFSSTKKANREEETQLLQLAAKIPFDDRICQNAEIDDLNLGAIRNFLHETKSDLFETSGQIPFKDLVLQMQIARGPDEFVKPLNVGILFFGNNPQGFFPYARIEVVVYHDEIGDNFTEKTFDSPLHQQLRDALDYINQHITEHVYKVSGKAEANRFFNYPFAAIKEALANAVYHRSYEEREPIEVNIRHDRIEILSFPGPQPPLTQADLIKGHIVSRRYLNRRIGDFLKELNLTEGRGTGIPKMRRAMEANGSPMPFFQTDENRSSFLSVLPIHPNVPKVASGGLTGEATG